MKTKLVINVTQKEREQIHNIARQRGYSITSDYIRDLIIKDAREHGDEIQFDVDRGGDRIQRD